MENLVWWMMTAAVTALAIVLWALFWTLTRKLDSLTTLVGLEVRALSERLIRVETKLWPDSRPPHL